MTVSHWCSLPFSCLHSVAHKLCQMQKKLENKPPTCCCCFSATELCPTLCNPVDYCSWDCPGKNTWVGCHFLLWWILQIQGSNPHLLRFVHWQAEPLPLRHLESRNCCGFIQVTEYDWLLIFGMPVVERLYEWPQLSMPLYPHLLVLNLCHLQKHTLTLGSASWPK